MKMDECRTLENRAKFLRDKMVQDIAVQMQIIDEVTLNAMRDVLRHCFVPDEEVEKAYELCNVSIMPGVTLSYPEIVAYMVSKAL